MLRRDTHHKKTDLPVAESLYPKSSKQRRQKKPIISIAAVGSVVIFLVWFFLFRHSSAEDSPSSVIHEKPQAGSSSPSSPPLPPVADQESRIVDVKSDTMSNEFPDTVEYYDLNDYVGSPNGKENGDIILLCIPLRNAEKVLPLMFRNMMNMTYSHALVDIAFLVSDCSADDATFETLTYYTAAMQNGTLLKILDENEADMKRRGVVGTSDLYLSYMDNAYSENVKKAYSPPYHQEYEKPFRSVQIFRKDFGQVIGQGFSDRHDVKVQGIRRKLMGRARNWLLSSALKPYHSWVYWRDADIETSPGSIVEDLMKFQDYDVIVPNVWRPLPTFLGNEQPYDLNSWIESEAGLQLASTLGEDDVIVEGYKEYPTWRVHLAYIRQPDGDKNEIVDLDGVGGVSILARAKVFRQGVHFPAFTFMNHAETEAFGKLAKKQGFRVGGLPHYTVWHIYEPSEDDLRDISRMERKKRRQRRGD